MTTCADLVEAIVQELLSLGVSRTAAARMVRENCFCGDDRQGYNDSMRRFKEANGQRRECSFLRDDLDRVSKRLHGLPPQAKERLVKKTFGLGSLLLTTPAQWDRTVTKFEEFLATLAKMHNVATSLSRSSRPFGDRRQTEWTSKFYAAAEAANLFCRASQQREITATVGNRFHRVAGLLLEAYTGVADADMKRACSLVAKISTGTLTSKNLRELPDYKGEHVLFVTRRFKEDGLIKSVRDDRG